MTAPWTSETRDDRGVFADLARWWNECAGPRSTPYLRSEWFELWSRSFLGEGHRLEVVVWFRGDDPVAALPLTRRGPRRSSLSNSHSDVFDVISGGEVDPVPAAREWLSRRPVTRLFRLDGSSALIPARPDPDFRVDRTDGSPYLPLSGGDDVTSNLSRQLVKEVHRSERRLMEMGEVTYLDNADGVIPDVLGECMRLEASGWKGREGTAMASRPESERFYRELADLARDHDWLRVCALLVSDQIAAFEIDLDYAGRRFSLKAGYDERWSRQSPGKILQLRVLEAAARHGLAGYEFGGVAEPWKLQWTKETRPRLNVLSFGSRGAGGWLGRVAKAIPGRRPSPNREAPG